MGSGHSAYRRRPLTRLVVAAGAIAAMIGAGVAGLAAPAAASASPSLAATGAGGGSGYVTRLDAAPISVARIDPTTDTAGGHGGFVVPIGGGTATTTGPNSFTHTLPTGDADGSSTSVTGSWSCSGGCSGCWSSPGTGWPVNGSWSSPGGGGWQCSKPSLTVAKTGPATGTAGGEGTYTITATNSGTASAVAGSVSFTDTLPTGETYVSSTTETGSWTCSSAGPVVECSDADALAPGATASVQVTVSYASDTGGTSLADCATTNGQASPSCVTTAISTPTPGPGCVGCVATTTPVLTVGVLETNNAADPAGMDFSQTQTAQSTGETFTFQVVITNTASTTEDIASITDLSPEVITNTVSTSGGVASISDLLPAANPTGVCANLVGASLIPGAFVVCDFSGLAPATNGASITDSVRAVVDQAGNPTNTAAGTSASTVLTPPTVAITKANNAAGTGYGSSETAVDGETSVPYRVVVTNTNSSPGTITALSDTLNGIPTTICSSDIGLVLTPGASVTCDFTGPVPAMVTTDTAAVSLSVNGIVVSATASSRVFPPVLAVKITKLSTTAPTTVPVVASPPVVTKPSLPAPPLTSLAFTGASVSRTLGIALGLVLTGLVMLGALFLTDRRRPATVGDETQGA